jgi:hypothetical protein
VECFSCSSNGGIRPWRMGCPCRPEGAGGTGRSDRNGHPLPIVFFYLPLQIKHGSCPLFLQNFTRLLHVRGSDEQGSPSEPLLVIKIGQ